MMRFVRAGLVLAAWVGNANAYIDENGEVVIPGASSYNGLNLVPQMGWNTW
jgi:alpha-galactosidase